MVQLCRLLFGLYPIHNMKTLIATLQLCLFLAFEGCATKYSEPNPTKIVESTQKVKEGINKAHENSKKVTKAIATAQEAADAIALLSHTVIGKIEELLGLVPEQFRAPLLEIKTDVINLQTQQNLLAYSLSEAYKLQDLQETTLVNTKLREAKLEKDQWDYQKEAQDLARIATSQSAKLAWYQRHWWGSWIALGTGVILCLLFAVLKFLGKLPI